jgi:hypothetical protein
MLPVTFQFIIAMVAYAINEQLARRIEYLLEEVRVLREVYTESTGRKRIPFTDEQRRRLVIKGYTKIRDALRGLKIEIGRTIVANILTEAGIEPAPERNRKRTWKQFRDLRGTAPALPDQTVYRALSNRTFSSGHR